MPLVPLLLNNASLASTTRPGLSGYSRGRFGDFSGKPEDIGERVEIFVGDIYEIFIQRNENVWERTAITFTGEKLGKVGNLP